MRGPSSAQRFAAPFGSGGGFFSDRPVGSSAGSEPPPYLGSVASLLGGCSSCFFERLAIVPELLFHMFRRFQNMSDCLVAPAEVMDSLEWAAKAHQILQKFVCKGAVDKIIDQAMLDEAAECIGMAQSLVHVVGLVGCHLGLG